MREIFKANLLKYKRRWKTVVHLSEDHTQTTQWFRSEDQARRCAEQHIFKYCKGAGLEWGETIDMRRPQDRES